MFLVKLGRIGGGKKMLDILEGSRDLKVLECRRKEFKIGDLNRIDAYFLAEFDDEPLVRCAWRVAIVFPCVLQ